MLTISKFGLFLLCACRSLSSLLLGPSQINMVTFLWVLSAKCHEDNRIAYLCILILWTSSENVIRVLDVYPVCWWDIVLVVGKVYH